MHCPSFYISHIWLDTEHQFWQGEVDRWHFHSQYLLPSYIKVFYKTIWCSWISNAYANLWNPFSLLPQNRFTRFSQTINFYFSSPDLGSVARILQWRHRCYDHLDYHDHDNKVNLIKKNVQNSVLPSSAHRILYSRNDKDNRYKAFGAKISGMFGWTSVTCDWLMVGLNTINQS